MCLAKVKEDVEFAFRLLEFAIRTMCYFELGKVDIGLFGQNTIILDENGNINFNGNYFSSKDNAVIVSQINVGAAFGASAIQLNKFFETAGTKRNPDSDDLVSTLSCLVYAVRNAFAHEIADPKWKIDKKYRKKLNIELEGDKITIALDTLHGCEFKYEQIGGLGNWYKIKNESLKLLEAS